MYFEFFEKWIYSSKVLNKNKDKSITHNVFRIQDNESIVCGSFCITFIKYIFVGKNLLDYAILFSLSDYKKNGIIMYKYFKK